MIKRSHLTAIRSVRSSLASHESILRDEVEWAWLALAESFERDSGCSPEERDKLDLRYKGACLALGEAIGASKDLERLSWELSKVLEEQGREQI